MISYTEIWQELEFWIEHADNLEDVEIVDTVIHLCYDIPEIDEVLINYYDDFDCNLSEADRELLKWYFVLVSTEDFIEEF